MRKLSTGLFLLLLLSVPTLRGQELRIPLDQEGRLKGLDLLPVVSPQEIELPGLDMTLDRDAVREGWTDAHEVKHTWVGQVRGLRNSRAVFTSVGGLTAGIVTLPGMGLLILPDGRLWRQTEDFSCATDEEGSAVSLPERDVMSTPAQKGPSEIRLALPFSKGAPALVGGTAALKTILWNQEDLLNDWLRASGLDNDLTIKVVAVRQVNYDENNPRRSGLNYIFQNFRGFMRNNKADLLLMIVSRFPGQGAAGSACQFDGRPDCSFGVVDLRYIRNYVVLHELGHLLNARHETGYYACPSRGQLLGKDFATVMWQGPGPDPNECSAGRIGQFSNPEIIHAGSGVPTGDATHCNACRIRDVAERVSGFRN